MPACTAEAAGLMGKGGRHLNVRLHCGGAHLRAVGFGHGHRLDELADGERVDVHVSLGIERYQGLVGPRVSIDRLEPVVAPSTPAVACAPACDLACAARVTLAQVRRRIEVALPDPVAPEPSRPPRAVEDERGSGTALVRIAALAGADAGVAVVVADLPRRRSMLEDVLHPERIGVELAVIGGLRCAPGPLAERMARAGRRASIVVVDYAALAASTLPAEAHLVVLDPPQDPNQARWLRTHAADRYLHLAWAEHEIAFARLVGARALGSATAGPADLARSRRARALGLGCRLRDRAARRRRRAPPSGCCRGHARRVRRARAGGVRPDWPRHPDPDRGALARARQPRGDRDRAACRSLRVPRSRDDARSVCGATTTPLPSRVPGARCCSAAAQRSTVYPMHTPPDIDATIPQPHLAPQFDELLRELRDRHPDADVTRDQPRHALRPGASRRAGAPLRRAVHHPPGRLRADRRRRRHGRRLGDRRAAARHRRGHWRDPCRHRARVRRRGGDDRRRCDQVVEDPLRLQGRAPGRELPQVDRLDVGRHPGADRQAGGPPAQHAHACVHDQAKADPEGPRDARGLRTARASTGYPVPQVGARGSGLRGAAPAPVLGNPADGQPAACRPRIVCRRGRGLPVG